jgi:hypothetical protein
VVQVKARTVFGSTSRLTWSWYYSPAAWIQRSAWFGITLTVKARLDITAHQPQSYYSPVLWFEQRHVLLAGHVWGWAASAYSAVDLALFLGSIVVIFGALPGQQRRG